MLCDLATVSSLNIDHRVEIATVSFAHPAATLAMPIIFLAVTHRKRTEAFKNAPCSSLMPSLRREGTILWLQAAMKS